MATKCVVKDKCGCRDERTGHCNAAFDSYSRCVEARLADDAEQIKNLTEVCNDSNAVCICGCPTKDHEQYGEEGEDCGHEDHECFRVCKSALAVVNARKAEIAALRADHSAMEHGYTVLRHDLALILEVETHSVPELLDHATKLKADVTRLRARTHEIAVERDKGEAKLRDEVQEHFGERNGCSTYQFHGAMLLIARVEEALAARDEFGGRAREAEAQCAVMVEALDACGPAAEDAQQKARSIALEPWTDELEARKDHADALRINAKYKAIAEKHNRAIGEARAKAAELRRCALSSAPNRAKNMLEGHIAMSEFVAWIDRRGMHSAMQAGREWDRLWNGMRKSVDALDV